MIVDRMIALNKENLALEAIETLPARQFKI
jgi:hypothetical protein